MTLEIILYLVVGLAALAIIYAIASFVFYTVLEIAVRGLLPFLIVRYFTLCMDSDVSWTLSIAAALVAMFPKIKQLFKDPQAFFGEMSERMDRVNRRNSSYRRSESNTDTDDSVAPEFRNRVCCGSCFWNKSRESYYTNCDLHPDKSSASDHCSDWRTA